MCWFQSWWETFSACHWSKRDLFRGHVTRFSCNHRQPAMPDTNQTCTERTWATQADAPGPRPVTQNCAHNFKPQMYVWLFFQFSSLPALTKILFVPNQKEILSGWGGPFHGSGPPKHYHFAKEQDQPLFSLTITPDIVFCWKKSGIPSFWNDDILTQNEEWDPWVNVRLCLHKVHQSALLW